MSRTVPVAENYDFPSDVTNCRREDRFFPEVILIVLISDVQHRLRVRQCVTLQCRKLKDYNKCVIFTGLSKLRQYLYLLCYVKCPDIYFFLMNCSQVVTEFN